MLTALWAALKAAFDDDDAVFEFTALWAALKEDFAELCSQRTFTALWAALKFTLTFVTLLLLLTAL